LKRYTEEARRHRLLPDNESIPRKVNKRIQNSKTVPPDKCVFCKIIARKLPAHIVYEDDRYIAFLDSAPFNEGHALVCPKKHGETIWDMNEEEIGGLFMVAARVSKAVVEATNTDGFRFVQNNGEAANQVVPHVHVHIIPTRFEDKGRWVERKRFTEGEMDETAGKIRRAFAKESQANV
jgi:histidine triad (HIT) family protein